MKFLFLIFIFSLSLKADSMYQGKCVNNIVGLNTTSFRIYYTNGTNSTSTSQAVLTQIMDNFGKFQYDSVTKQCLMIANYTADTLGLTYDEFNYLMALWGVLLSSVIFFGFVKVV
jgi:hypothetical protein